MARLHRPYPRATHAAPAGNRVLYSIWGELRDALTIVTTVVLMVAAEVFNDYRASRTIAGLSKIAERAASMAIRGRMPKG
jgi:hypothetical protein